MTLAIKNPNRPGQVTKTLKARHSRHGWGSLLRSVVLTYYYSSDTHFADAEMSH